jgi:hypothetical protein
MNWKLGRFGVSKWAVFIFTCAIIVVGSGVAAFQSNHSSFFPSLFSGVCSGVLILAVDKWLDLAELKFMTNRDHIFGSIDGRENAEYYAKLVSGAKREIAFYGRTGYRLLTDFADIDSRDAGKRVLLSALDRGVRVRFLIAHDTYLDPKGREDAESAAKLVAAIRAESSRKNFEIRFYSSSPTFSYFRADETIIFGVNFPNKKSRHTPSVIASSASVAAAAYAEFFDEAWASSDA